MKRLLKNKYLLIIILSTIIACGIIIPNIIKGKGILTVSADFNYQQIPFGISLNNDIKNNNISWNWNNDLGSGFIGSYSFYNLGSIFFWFTLIFPSKIYPYLIGPVMILKFVVASLTAFIFLKRYVKNKNYAVLGALLYSFSGFQITNILFNHFHEVVALFPLLLIGMDKLIIENKKGVLAIAVAICSITNYFFFIGQVVFVIIYFIIKIITKEYKINAKKFGELILECILGFGISAVLFIPSILFTMTNPRVETSWNFISAIKPTIKNVLEIFRAVLMPPDTMSMRSMFSQTNFCSVECYLPFVGTILYFSYIWNKRKDWISILIVSCFIISIIPILNSMFFALTTTYYARWFYMLILILCLASIKVLDEKQPIKSGLILTAIGYFLFVVLILAYNNRGNIIIYNEKYLFQNVLSLIFGILGTVIAYQYKEKSNLFIVILTLGITISSIYIGNKFFDRYYEVVKIDDYYIYKLLDKESDMCFIKDGERTDGDETAEYNIGYILGIPYLKNWNSTINGNIIKFYNSLGIFRGVDTKFNDEDYKIRDFLSVRYIFSKNDNKEQTSSKQKLVKNIEEYNIYENTNFITMGIPYNYYILKSEYDKLDNKTKRDLLIYAVVLDERQIELYEDIISPFNMDNLEKYNNEYDEFVKELKKKTSYDFKYTNNGCEFKINSDSNKIIILSIPYDEGWKIYLNGKEIEYENVDNGLVGVVIEEGENNIKLVYKEMGLKAGKIISLMSAIGLLAYMVISKIEKNKDIKKAI